MSFALAMSPLLDFALLSECFYFSRNEFFPFIFVITWSILSVSFKDLFICEGGSKHAVHLLGSSPTWPQQLGLSGAQALWPSSAAFSGLLKVGSLEPASIWDTGVARLNPLSPTSDLSFAVVWGFSPAENRRKHFLLGDLLNIFFVHIMTTV